MAHTCTCELATKCQVTKYLGMDMNLVSVDGILCPFKKFSYFTGVVILLVSVFCIGLPDPAFRAILWSIPSEQCLPQNAAGNGIIQAR